MAPGGKWFCLLNMFLFSNDMMIKLLTITSVIWIASATMPTANDFFDECEFGNALQPYDETCSSGATDLLSCNPGMMKVAECIGQGGNTSNICVNCPQKHYQSYYNNCTRCHQCSVCRPNEVISEPCTDETDTVCRSIIPPEPVTATAPDPDSTPQSQAPTRSTTTTTITNLPTTPQSVVSTVSSRVPVVTYGNRTTEIFSSETTTAGNKVPVPIPAYKGNCEAVVPLIVCVVILAMSLVAAVVCCFYFKTKANEHKRPNGNADGDVEGRPCRNNEFIPLRQDCIDEIHDGNPPPQPPCPDRPDAEHARYSCPNGIGTGSMPSPQEPLYAAVNKSGKSTKPKAADPERVHSVPLKSSEDPLQSPSSSSTRQSPRRNPVCKTVCKVFRRDGERATKKKHEPGSEVEKDALLKLPSGSGKRKPYKKSLLSADDPIEPGGSKASPSMNLTVPPWSASPSSTPSPPLPSPLPMLEQPAPLPTVEQPLQQLTVTSPPQSLSQSSPSASPATPQPSSSPPPPSSSSTPSSSSSSPSSQPPPPPSSSPPSSSSPSQPPPSPSASPSSSSSSSPSQPPPSPSASPSSSLLDKGQLQNSTRVKEDNVEEDGSENDPGADDGTTKESSSRVAEDLERGAEGGAGSLPSVTPGAKPKVKGPDSGDDVGEETKEELKNPLINPDEPVSEQFLDSVTDMVNIEVVERISRQLGLRQVDIDNLTLPSSYSPRNKGFKILLDVRDQLGCKLTFRHMVTTMKKCGQKNAGDKLIAEFRINMDLEER